MTMSQDGHSPASNTGRSADLSVVSDLLERRAVVAGWLERLEEAPTSNRRAAERVRTDYRQRLDAVMEELSGHRDALREQRRRLSDSLDQAEAAHQEARDALDEGELRHSIGELAEAEWADRRMRLEESVAAAAAALREAREEAARLDEVLDSLEEGIDPIPSAESDSRLPAPLPSPAGSQPDAGTAPTAQPFGAEPETGAQSEPDGSAFLEELDRAIEGSSDTRPRPGAKCPDCGYTNDFDAWYCGVCGVDLA